MQDDTSSRPFFFFKKKIIVSHVSISVRKYVELFIWIGRERSHV